MLIDVTRLYPMCWEFSFNQRRVCLFGPLECDQYTKTENLSKYGSSGSVTGGNHKLIHLWWYENALNLLLKQRRPDHVEEVPLRREKSH